MGQVIVGGRIIRVAVGVVIVVLIVPVLKRVWCFDMAGKYEIPWFGWSGHFEWDR